MNLRNITIWTTLVLLIITLAAPTTLAFCWNWKVVSVDDYHNITFLFAFLFSGSVPPVISLVIARKLKYNAPALALFISTIAYASWYVYGFAMFFVDFWIGFLMVALAAIALSLPIMIPAWITALVLNRHYAKKSVPAPETDENEVI